MCIEDLVNKVLQENLERMIKTGALFISKVPGIEIWQAYMNGFGNDKKFRDPESSVHNCNCCQSFFRHYGNIVAVDKGLNILTLFDGDNFPDEYKKSFENCAKLLRNSAIENVFIETFDNLNKLPFDKGIHKSDKDFLLGFEKNVKIYTKEEASKFGIVKAGEPYTFKHFHIRMPKTFINNTYESKESLLGNFRTNKEVFERALREITTDTFELVRDLISQGSLLDGLAHKEKVDSIIPLSKEFSELDRNKQDNWLWVKSLTYKYVRFKNELIGVLCSDLAQGVELNKACQDWNKRVDPVNYMKAKSPITKKQIEEAKKFVEENGFVESFNRRCATIDDINVEDILHFNVGDGKLKPISIFDKVKPTTCTRHKKSEFKGIEELPIDKFMTDVLPNCTGVEALFTSDHKGNLVTLTTANDKSSKEIFKWHNNFSWTYNGNLAGKSQIKEAVKAAGGFVDAPFRFSIMWNEDWSKNPVRTDLDAHCIEPSGDHIYYGSNFVLKRGDIKTKNGGQLDIDMINPPQIGIENIYYKDKSKLKDGAYRFYVHHYSGQRTTFKAELVFDDQVYTYHYAVPSEGYMDIATVHIKNGEIDHIDQSKWLVSEDGANETVWGLNTNEFQEVNLICLSPNQWEAGKETGNKHYFFMMNKCKCPNKLRSFHIENLKPELAKHRKVLEVLANQSLIDSTDRQLSGLGFDATVRDSIILKLKGSHNRVIKVNF